ncbi:ABC transporter ATP-binding protein [Anoxybacillus sp. D401a]|uniref:ABC transporter ATP-binding protein n=1 Tax=Anoxybacillus sp. D401a TaxID=575112 RepID=UPI003D338F8F
MDRQNILEVSNVSKVFKWKDKTIRAVNQVSFRLTEKAIIGISGRNGSGKTTLLKLIAGLLIPDEGNVMLFGQPLNDRNAKENVSILLEGSRSFYWNLRGRENLEYFCQLNKIRNMKKEIDNMIELLRLDTFIDNLTGSYSRGMQQKLSLAIALLSKPKLLILDEPTNGLDYESKVQLSKILQQLVSELGISILIVCHESVFLQSTVNHILIMEKGAIVESLKINKTDFNSYDFVSFEFSGYISDIANFPSNIFLDFKADSFVVYSHKSNKELYEVIVRLLECGYELCEIKSMQQVEGRT